MIAYITDRDNLDPNSDSVQEKKSMLYNSIVRHYQTAGI